MADAKHARLPNWSKSEMFLNRGSRYKSGIAAVKISHNNKKKQEAWKEVARTVYAQSSSGQPMDEVKKKWKDLVSQAKKDAHSEKYPRTGGGPQPQTAEWTEAILHGDDGGHLIVPPKVSNPICQCGKCEEWPGQKD